VEIEGTLGVKKKSEEGYLGHTEAYCIAKNHGTAMIQKKNPEKKKRTNFLVKEENRDLGERWCRGKLNLRSANAPKRGS